MSVGRTVTHTDSDYLMTGTHSLGETNKIVSDYGLDAKEFSDWTITRSSITADSVTDPDGGTTGVKLTEDATAGSEHYVVTGNQTISDDTSYTWSVYVKAGTKDRCVFRVYEDNPYADSLNLLVDMGEGTVTAAANNDVTLDGSSITSGSNGWYLVTITGQFASAANNNHAIIIFLTQSNALWTTSYNGDGASYIYIWGAKMTEPPTTLSDKGAGFESCGAIDGLYIENTTKDMNSLVATATEDTITTDDALPWDSGDTYKIYKTGTKNSYISKIVTDASRGWKTDPKDMDSRGWRKTDTDLDHDGRKIFGPGQPKKG